MSTVISLASQKGGVAKSASALNLAMGLAREGKKVALLDTDPQGSAALSLGYKPDELPMTLASIMGKIIENKVLDLSEGIIHHQEQNCSIDLVPANKQLSGIESSLSNVIGKEQILKVYLDGIKDHYSYVIIDTPPWLGSLTINALVASEKVIVPVQANYLSLMGMEKLFETIVQVKRWFNPSISVDGILITMLDKRSTFAKEIVNLIHMTYGSSLKVFESEIPLSVKMAECSAEGKSIYAHDPNGKAAQAYMQFTKEVLGHGKVQERAKDQALEL
jgi:chromosome partitioning protein